jgi:hypothetical protein
VTSPRTTHKEHSNGTGLWVLVSAQGMRTYDSLSEICCEEVRQIERHYSIHGDACSGLDTLDPTETLAVNWKNVNRYIDTVPLANDHT